MISPIDFFFFDDGFKSLIGSGSRKYGTRGKGAGIFSPKILLFM